MTEVRLVSRLRKRARPRDMPLLQQHGEIADFLGNLVRHRGDGGDDAELDIRQECRAR